MSLNSNTILSFLSNKNHNITVYDTIESTNKTAKEIAKHGAVHGSVIIANTQTGGKGRHGREFFSPPDSGIYMSLILDKAKTVLRPVTMITAFAAVAVCRAIESLCDAKPQIKWVNDIYIHDKKVGGILTESVTDIKTGAKLIVGIGINMNAPAKGFPPKLKDIAGYVFYHSESSRNRLAAEIINQMFTDGSIPHKPALLSEYKARLMMLGKKITVIDGDTAYEAVAMDIDSDGQLIVKNLKGSLITLSHGEISTAI